MADGRERHLARTTSFGIPDTALGLVMGYVDDPWYRDAISLVCRHWCRLAEESRKHVTIAMAYCTTPDRLLRRFPCLESPWIRELSASFSFLKAHMLRFLHTVSVRDAGQPGVPDAPALARRRRHPLRRHRLQLFAAPGPFSLPGCLPDSPSSLGVGAAGATKTLSGASISGRLGRQPLPLLAATSSTRTTRSPVSPLPSSWAGNTPYYLMMSRMF